MSEQATTKELTDRCKVESKALRDRGWGSTAIFVEMISEQLASQATLIDQQAQEIEKLQSANRRYAEVGANKIIEVDTLSSSLNLAIKALERELQSAKAWERINSADRIEKALLEIRRTNP